MNISVLDLKWDEKKHKSIPQKRRRQSDSDGNDQEQVTLNDFLFRNKIVEDIHDLGGEILVLGDLVEREQGSLILKERIDSIKSLMSRFLTNDVVDILHNGTKRQRKEEQGETQKYNDNSPVCSNCKKKMKEEVDKAQIVKTKDYDSFLTISKKKWRDDVFVRVRQAVGNPLQAKSGDLALFVNDDEVSTNYTETDIQS
ncbi:hypothetical protein TcasGA2_TC012982 [Tribolium castaneum]|uniref:Uncharacterized protein n=1 Tax=Tribolium castaneum TaxID=7070 RepID=D7GXS7_TRICA|nr:hypothetical protein TcasGA2_TC012982 [Tribolium castaneum]